MGWKSVSIMARVSIGRDKKGFSKERLEPDHELFKVLVVIDNERITMQFPITISLIIYACMTCDIRYWDIQE